MNKFRFSILVMTSMLVLLGTTLISTQNAAAHTSKSVIATKTIYAENCSYRIVYSTSGSRLVDLDECSTQQLISRYNLASIPGGFLGALKSWYGAAYSFVLSGYAAYIQHLDNNCHNTGVRLWIITVGKWQILVIPLSKC